MKVKLFPATIMLFCLGCAPQQQSDQLTQQQKDQIKTEVKTVCDSVWAKAIRLDGAGVVEYCADSPDFVDFNADGSRMDYAAFKKMAVDMFGTVTAVSLNPVREDVYVLAKDAAVYAWYGKSENDMKSGDKVTYDPDAETFVLQKIAGQWKIVYIQESATVVTKKAGKK